MAANQVPGPIISQFLKVPYFYTILELNFNVNLLNKFPLRCPPVRGQNQQEVCEAEFA